MSLAIDEMEKAIRHLVVEKHFQAGCVLDIGAGKGYWTQRYGHFFPAASIYMIDPLAESEAYLRAACKTNRRLHYLITAVGESAGSVKMNVTSDHDSSSLCEWDGQTDDRRRVVPVATVDDLIASGRIEPPHLVKIDVQGFELNVLRGGRRMFETAEVFIIEVNLRRFMHGCPLAHEVIGSMAGHDYYWFDIAGFLRRPFENDLGQLDLVFASSKGAVMSGNRWA